MNLSDAQIKLIYKAVRYYQLFGPILISEDYSRCDGVLNELFSTVHAVQQRRDAVCDT